MLVKNVWLNENTELYSLLLAPDDSGQVIAPQYWSTNKKRTSDDSFRSFNYMEKELEILNQNSNIDSSNNIIH